VLVKRDSL